MSRILLILCWIPCMTGLARAQVVQLEAFRFLEVEACGEVQPVPVCDSPLPIESSGAGALDEMLTASQDTGGLASASASQSSSVETGIYGGDLSVSACAGGGPGSNATASATTGFTVDFECTSSAQFIVSVSGSLGSASGSGLAEISLTDVGSGIAVFSEQISTSGSILIQEAPFLDLGSYQLTVQVAASADSAGGPTEATVQLGFTIQRFVIVEHGFIRGDCDADEVFNGVLDAIRALDFQFNGGPTPSCLEACDADGNGLFNGLLDGLRILSHQFVPGSPPPPDPFPDCGLDPDPGTSLGCEVYCF